MKPLECEYRFQFMDQSFDWIPSSWKDNHIWVEKLLSQDGMEFYEIIREWEYVKEPFRQQNGLISCDVKIILEPGICLSEEQAQNSLNFLLQKSEFTGLLSAEKISGFKKLD